MKPTLMLIGLGGLGSVLLELLAREEGLGRTVVGSRNVERGVARCNLAQGYAPAIRLCPSTSATASLFAREGAAVAIADLDEAGGEAVVHDIVESGGGAIFVLCNVAQAADCSAPCALPWTNWAGSTSCSTTPASSGAPRWSRPQQRNGTR